MTLSNEDIANFIHAYEQTYGVVLERAVAEVYAQKLLSLVATCGKADTGARDGEVGDARINN